MLKHKVSDAHESRILARHSFSRVFFLSREASRHSIASRRFSSALVHSTKIEFVEILRGANSYRISLIRRRARVETRVKPQHRRFPPLAECTECLQSILGYPGLVLLLSIACC
jgi:hypothetical protein